MKHKVRTALSLSLNDWRIFVQVWMLLLFVDVALRISSFSKVRGILDRQPRQTRKLDVTKIGHKILQTDYLVNTAARHHLYPMSCLRRALVLRWSLQRSGVDSQLRFGVHKDVNGLSAHAWMEYAGHPIGTSLSNLEGFVPLVAVEQTQ